MVSLLSINDMNTELLELKTLLSFEVVLFGFESEKVDSLRVKNLCSSLCKSYPFTNKNFCSYACVWIIQWRLSLPQVLSLAVYRSFKLFNFGLIE